MPQANLRMYEKLIGGLRSYATVRLGTQLLSWAGTVFVVRTLDSHAFGEFGVALVVFNSLAMVFDGTFLETLIQRPPESREDIRGAFTIIVGCGLALTGAAVALSGTAARLVGDPAVASLVCAAAVALALTSMCMLPHAALARHMEFRRLALIATAQGVCVTLSTVALAWCGAGAWALAGGLVLGTLVRLVLLNAAVFCISVPTVRLRRALAYVKFGGVLFADNVLWRWYTSLDTLLLGRWTGTAALGFYSLAQQVAELPLEKISTVVNEVSLPAYAHLNGERSAAARLMMETMRMHALAGFPIFWGLAAVAHAAVPALFGARWSAAVFPLAALAAVAPLRLIGSVETPAMIGLGRPLVLLKSKLIVAPCMTLALAAGAWFGGVNGAATAWLVAFPICYGVAFRLVLEAAGISYRAVLDAVRSPAAAAALMVLVLQLWDTATQRSVESPAYALLAEVAIGIMSYAVLLRVIDGEAYRLARGRISHLLGIAQRK